MKNKESRNRARLQILNYIVTFSTRTFYTQDYREAAIEEHSFFYPKDIDEIQLGSLVMITSAPFSKWYLGWLVEINKERCHLGTSFLIESIEDGSLCWWSNVGIKYFSPETVSRNPQWRWSDKQYELNDRWIKNIHKKREAYTTLPAMLEFEGDKVVFRTREKFGIGTFKAEKEFDNWRKVLVRDMLAFWDKAMTDKEAYYQEKGLPSIRD